MDLKRFWETLTPTFRTRSERVRKDEVRDLSSLFGANLVRVSEVNSRIDPRVNDLFNRFAKGAPLTRNARNCGRDRRAWIVSEEELHDRGNGRTVR